MTEKHFTVHIIINNPWISLNKVNTDGNYGFIQFSNEITSLIIIQTQPILCDLFKYVSRNFKNILQLIIGFECWVFDSFIYRYRIWQIFNLKVIWWYTEWHRSLSDIEIFIGGLYSILWYYRLRQKCYLIFLTLDSLLNRTGKYLWQLACSLSVGSLTMVCT